MRDFELQILEQYDIEVKCTRRIRGAFFCETNEGELLLKETNMSEKRADLLNALLHGLDRKGLSFVELPVRSKEGTWIVTSGMGERYILKHWVSGHECDIRKKSEILEATKQLACLHQIMQWDISWGSEWPEAGRRLDQVWMQHNRELRKVRYFIRHKVQKGPFEYLFLESFEEMLSHALHAEKMLEQLDYPSLYEACVQRGDLIHGDYNYHNILYIGNATEKGNGIQGVSDQSGIAITNFDHVSRDIQVLDLYYFLRKIMEKHNWDVNLGKQMLEAYEKVRPLSEQERRFLAVKIAYPEKFWKVANTYYCSNKAWIPEKNIEKLKRAVEQSEKKMYFLNSVF